MKTHKLIYVLTAICFLLVFPLRAQAPLSTESRAIQFAPSIESVVKNLQIHGAICETKDVHHVTTLKATQNADQYDGICYQLDKQTHKVYVGHFTMLFWVDGKVQLSITYDPLDVSNYATDQTVNPIVPPISAANIP